MNLVETLEPLRQELVALGWDANLHDDSGHPYVQIMHGCLAVEHVFVAWCDEPAYQWSNTMRGHPLDDPAGAATRITTDTAQRRETTTTT